MSKKKPKGPLEGRTIFIATPAYDGKVGLNYCHALIDTAVLLIQLGAQVIKGGVSDSGSVPRSRNMMAARACAAGATDLLFIDADMGWNAPDAARLLMWDADIVAAAYPARSDKNARWIVVTDQTTRMDMKSGLISVKRAGTGFMRIRTNVFKKIQELHPELHFEAFHTPYLRDPALHALFSQKYAELPEDAPRPGYSELKAYSRELRARQANENRQADNLYAYFNYGRPAMEPDGHVGLLSEDYHFCDLARSCGFEILIDPEIWMLHEGRRTWEGKFKDAITITEVPEEQAQAAD